MLAGVYLCLFIYRGICGYFYNEGMLYISTSGYAILIWEDYFPFLLSSQLSISLPHQPTPAFPCVNTEKGSVVSQVISDL